jgi:signal transduction histidine kinase
MLNVVKHANATRAEVEVTADQRQIAILVRDNGKSITISKHDKPGIGLPAIRNKVGLLKGSINIQSIPNKGTTVEIMLPHQVNLNSHVYSKHTIG